MYMSFPPPSLGWLLCKHCFGGVGFPDNVQKDPLQGTLLNSTTGSLIKRHLTERVFIPDLGGRQNPLNPEPNPPIKSERYREH